MARKLIDSSRAEMLIKRACCGYPSLASAMVGGLYIKREADEAIEICMPYAGKIVNKIISLPTMSRCEYDDLEAAALLGLTEGVYSYEHERPVQIQTHVYYQMWKRISDERAQSHWATMRPPRAMIDKFMAGHMSAAEEKAYVTKFVARSIMPGEEEDFEGFERTRVPEKNK